MSVLRMPKKKPTLDDTRWRKDTHKANGLMWVIVNHGQGRRVIGVHSGLVSSTSDIEAWMPFEPA